MNKHKKRPGEQEERDPETGRIYVDSVDQIPHFASDEEEAEFWETHEPTMKLYGRRGMSLEEALAEANAREHPEER
jgi:hypothetical protein